MGVLLKNQPFWLVAMENLNFDRLPIAQLRRRDETLPAPLKPAALGCLPMKGITCERFPLLIASAHCLRLLTRI